MNLRRHYSNILCLLGVIGILTAKSASADIESIRISSRLDPNAIIITEVDVVFVYEQSLLENFPATKSEWYSGKFIFTRNAGDGIDIINTFVPQGFDYLDLNLPDRKEQALKVFVFAQHDDSSRAALDITDSERVLIEIDPFGVVVSE